jgi:hypothetical protein
MGAGQTWTSSVGDTATYYATTVRGSDRLVDAGFCAAPGAGAADVSAYSWVLVERGGHLIRPDSHAATPSPGHPSVALVQAGSCVRGWVGFAVPSGADVVRVGYEPDGRSAPLATWNP